MTTELVLATNVIKAVLGAAAAAWTLLLMTVMHDNRRALFWLLLGLAEVLGAIALSAGWFGYQRLTALGFVAGTPDVWRDSGMAAVLNVIYAHGCWIVILVSYRVWHAQHGTRDDRAMQDMPRYAGRSLLAIVLLVLAVGLLLRLL